MCPVKYIEMTRAKYLAQGFPVYQWTVNEAAPWTPFTKRLGKCRVALLSSGGISLKSQPPFNPGGRDDFSFREIPRDVDVRDLVINHDYYDHADAERDINCVFPIERLGDLEKEGYIGELAPFSYTFMGRVFRRGGLQQEMAPDLVRRLKANKIDALLGVPA